MGIEQHLAYKEEVDRLNLTLKYVDDSLNSSLNQKMRVDDEVSKGNRHFDSLDSQSYIGLMVNTMLQDRLSLKINNLKKAADKPYFARIDFREYDKKSIEKLYIGKMVLIKDEDKELIIVDWRAPVANLYYEARLGEANYESPDGKIDGELMLKRQFSIEKGKLIDLFDIDITTNDEFLQSYLGANADNRLKDIVSTIQVEQNKVIRADMWEPLIVQGAAGSGKTTIALHRIAYLIYTYEKSFTPENFMIIAPNKLFLNYISNVLPELGVERVKQTTFEGFAIELIGKKLKIEDTNEKLNRFINKSLPENDMIKASSQLKSSINFKQIIDDYVSEIEKSYIPKEDFAIDGVVVYKYEDINKLFLEEYKDLPFKKRIGEIKKHLLNRLKKKKIHMINAIETSCDKTLKILKDAMEDGEERRELIIELLDDRDNNIKNIEIICKNSIKEYINKISKTDPVKYYEEFILDKELFFKVVSGKIDGKYIEPIRNYSEKVLLSGYVEIEDLAPIIYIKYLIYGMDEKIPVKHIVIDEAQDFSVFQFYVMKKIVKDSSFTILGDLCQGIHSYRGTKDWKDVIKYVFEDNRVKFLSLEQSYRTTVEIMEASNRVIDKINRGNLTLAKPVIRHGHRVIIEKKMDLKDIASDIIDRMGEFRELNYQSIAIICKTMDECLKMQTLLKKEKPYVITGKEKVYKGGFVIVPSHLSKGLEFDAVIIANASADMYDENELDTKLLYVAMTRALHKLYIYYYGEISPLIIDDEPKG